MYLLPTPHPKRPAPSPRGRRRARRPHLRRLGGGGGGGAGPSPAHPCASSPCARARALPAPSKPRGQPLGTSPETREGARGNAELTLWGPSPPLDAVARVTERHFRPPPPAQRLHTRSSDRGGRLASSSASPTPQATPIRASSLYSLPLTAILFICGLLTGIHVLLCPHHPNAPGYSPSCPAEDLPQFFTDPHKSCLYLQSKNQANIGVASQASPPSF